MHEIKDCFLDDPHDPRFLLLQSLQTPQARFSTNLYLIEGIRHVARALEAGVRFHSFFVDPSRLTNLFGRRLPGKLRKSDVPAIRLSPKLYRQLTLAAEPQGIGAVLRQHWSLPEEMRPLSHSAYLAIESIDSPGNLGTIIRTAEATGISTIFMIGQSTDPWDPAAVRASMGSLFSQKLVRCSGRDFSEWAKKFGVVVVGSSPKGLIDYKALRYRWPAALLIGSEKHGLSEHLIETSDFMVRIPMTGRGDSINAAVAAGVLLYEMFNQRRGA